MQLTRIRIKVEKGARGARCGMLFVYKDAPARDDTGGVGGAASFDLDSHVARFEGYNSWQQSQYAFCQKVRSEGIAGKADNPVAFFTLEDDWYVLLSITVSYVHFLQIFIG